MINWKENFLVRYIFKDILTSFCETSTSYYRYFIYHNLASLRITQWLQPQYLTMWNHLYSKGPNSWNVNFLIVHLDVISWICLYMYLLNHLK